MVASLSNVLGRFKRVLLIARLWLEGARWDDKAGHLVDSKAKELLCAMPVLLVRAVPADKVCLCDLLKCSLGLQSI